MQITGYTREAWERLGHLVRRRRQELGYTQSGLANAGGPSVSVISRIEGSRSTLYEERIIRRLERALGWQEGSVVAVLEGGNPIVADPLATQQAQRRLAPVPPPSQEPPTDGPGHYPPWVGTRPFFRHIYDYSGPDATPEIKEVAIRAIRLALEVMESRSAQPEIGGRSLRE